MNFVFIIQSFILRLSTRSNAISYFYRRSNFYNVDVKSNANATFSWRSDCANCKRSLWVHIHWKISVVLFFFSVCVVFLSYFFNVNCFLSLCSFLSLSFDVLRRNVPTMDYCDLNYSERQMHKMRPRTPPLPPPTSSKRSRSRSRLNQNHNQFLTICCLMKINGSIFLTKDIFFLRKN